MVQLQARFYCGLREKHGNPIEVAVYAEVMDRHFSGYTVYPTIGRWKGENENSVVFEVFKDSPLDISEGDTLIWLVAEELREAGNQDCVLITQQYVEVEFI